MIHIFASAPLPPLSFSFSPPSSSPPCSSSAGLLLLSAAETGCVTSLKAGAVPWLEQEGEKNGEKIRRWVRPHVAFAFSNIPLSSDHVCVSVCVCACFVASLLPLRSSRATNFMQRRESGSSKEPVLPWKHRRKSGTRQVVPSPLCTAAVTSIGVN